MPTYADLDLAFTKHPATKDVMKKIDVEAVKGAMRNILLSNTGSKAFDMYYGLGLQAAVFEMNDTLTQIAIERSIKEKLALYEPRVEVESIVFDYDDVSVAIEIYYYVVGVAQLQTLNIAIERAR